MRLVIGTRGSQLAIWQAEYIAGRLRAFAPDVEVSLRYFVTQGDRVQDKPLPLIGGKGLFTAELEQALRLGEIDLAVHSLKDLPTDLPSEFVIGAVPERASIFDVLISRAGYTLQTLPQGATVGTSSLRREAQLKAVRPDLVVRPLRGNVPTRVQKAVSDDSAFDAIVLAQAGLERLSLMDGHREALSTDVMLPAPGQGALGVQCRTQDMSTRAVLAQLDHGETRLAVEAERAYLNRLDSGCRLPVAALARLEGASLSLVGRVISVDGTQMITTTRSIQIDPITDAQDLAYTHARSLGQEVAQEAIAHGAGDLLAAVRQQIAG